MSECNIRQLSICLWGLSTLWKILLCRVNWRHACMLEMEHASRLYLVPYYDVLATAIDSAERLKHICSHSQRSCSDCHAIHGLRHEKLLKEIYFGHYFNAFARPPREWLLWLIKVREADVLRHWCSAWLFAYMQKKIISPFRTKHDLIIGDSKVQTVAHQLHMFFNALSMT